MDRVRERAGVESTEPTSPGYTSVKLGERRSLKSQYSPAKGPDDGRTEVYVDKDGIKNDGYKVSKKPEEANTIVFRSYKDPDETSSTLTKLKVKYVNTVKTGGLKIQKKAADGEKDTIKGTYTFKVTFNDVGGEGLEEKPIERTVTIDMNKDDTGTITGIPVGTRYTIEEVETSDGSTLQSVTVPKGQIRPSDQKHHGGRRELWRAKKPNRSDQSEKLPQSLPTPSAN